MGWIHLRSQITAQEKRNMDLTASNDSLRKSNEKMASQLKELRTRNEELSSNNTSLVEENAKILGKLDGVKDELEGEKVVVRALSPSWSPSMLRRRRLW